MDSKIPKSELIQRFLLQSIWECSDSPVHAATEKFGISRQAVHRHLNELVDQGLIRSEGVTRNSQYFLVPILSREGKILLNDLEEHKVWDELVVDIVSGLTKDDMDICNYGFTEIVNNAIDHSGGLKLSVSACRTAVSVVMTVSDDGVGIFEKIKEVFGYTPEEAALELTKGKLTTDPKRHSGEGIFFTSRVFDRFSLVSDTRVFTHNRSSSDWQIEQENRIVKGTFVCLELLISSGRTMQQMFDEFSSGPDDYIFSKTSVPLKLALFGNENLNSRSQAKRVLARVDRFDEVCLDFAEVEHIGQGFADEIFRVFRNEKPHVNIVPLNASTQVVKMIRRAQHSFDVQSDA